VDVDEDGFIQEPDKWNERVAAALASTEGITSLTEDHWKVMNYLRKYYLDFGVAPMIRKLCKETGYPLKTIYELFPSGPAKGPASSPPAEADRLRLACFGRGGVRSAAADPPCRCGPNLTTPVRSGQENAMPASAVERIVVVGPRRPA